MPQRKPTKRDPAPTIRDVRALLRDAGLRSTAPRIAVVHYLVRATSPMSHAEIVEALASRGFDRATIYRNLMDLTDAGLVFRTDLGDHVWRFELKREGDAHTVEHPHFVCIDCGNVSCLPEGSIRVVHSAGLPRAVGAHAVEVHLKGRCDRCH